MHAKIRDRFYINMDSYNQKSFNLYLCCLFFQNYFAFIVFKCSLLTKFSNHSPLNDCSHLHKHEAKGKYSIFSVNLMVLEWLGKRVLVNFKWILVLVSIVFFLQSDKTNQSKIQMASS